MPGGDPGHLDLGRPGGTGADGAYRPARQARDDRIRPRDRVFTSNAVFAWAKDQGVAWHYIAPGKPMQNGHIESFNGKMCDELLNESLFLGLTHTRQADLPPLKWSSLRYGFVIKEDGNEKEAYSGRDCREAAAG